MDHVSNSAQTSAQGNPQRHGGESRHETYTESHAAQCYGDSASGKTAVEGTGLGAVRAIRFQIRAGFLRFEAVIP